MPKAPRSSGTHRELAIAESPDENNSASSSLTLSWSSCWTPSLKDVRALHGQLDSCSKHNRTLYGRTKEIKLLTDAYKHVRSRDPGTSSSRVLLVHGPTFSGKTALYEAVRDPIVTDGAFFVVGKSDQLHTSHPFYSLTSPLTDLCDVLAQQDSGILVQIKHDLTRALGHEQARSLASIIRSLPKLTGIEAEAERTTSALARDMTQLKTACLCFLRTISKPSSPVVLVFDDLQWGDDQSIELLRLLLSDPTSELLKNLLIICSYTDHDDRAQLPQRRPSSSLDNHFSLHLHQSAFHIPSNRAQLGALAMSHIELILSDRLLITRSAAEPLAKLVWDKTSGLPGDVVNFIDTLHSERLLVCHPSGWEWDVDRIHSMKPTTVQQQEGFCT